MATSPVLASRRRFLRRASTGAAAGLVFGIVPWEDVLARAHTFGIVPGTRVDAQGRALGVSTGGMDPFVGEIIMSGFNFAPRNYAFCNGQILPIQQNTALFSLLGTSFGGDGKVTFGLPDLQGRMPRGLGQGPGLSDVNRGQASGEEAVTMLSSQLPNHAHGGPTVGTGRRTRTLGATSLPSAVTEQLAYGSPPAAGYPASTSLAGGNQSIYNMPPYLGINFCIALQGVFPTPRP